MVHYDFNTTAMDTAIRNLFLRQHKTKRLILLGGKISHQLPESIGRTSSRIPEDVVEARPETIR